MPTSADHDPTTERSWRHRLQAVGLEVGVPVTIGVVALTAITVGVGLLIGRDPASGVGAADLRLVEDLVARRTPTIDDLTGVGAHLAGTVTVTVLWLGAMVGAAVVTRRWTISLFLLAAIGGEKLTYLLAGLIVGRPRPPVESLGEVFATSSFPSGHVGSAVTVYGGLAVALVWYLRVHRGRAVGVASRIVLGVSVAAITAFVAFSRVWRGHHYTSDIVAGALLGTAWLVVAWWVVLRRSDASSYPIRPSGGAGVDEPSPTSDRVAGVVTDAGGHIGSRASVVP